MSLLPTTSASDSPAEGGLPLARCVMVLGTSSGAGKSWVATALCRWYANQGLRVAPFKAQNMSNNARVVPTPSGGLGEIGSAQYFQALAARTEPDVRMNPLLLKPEADTRSQVVLWGEVNPELTATPWRSRSERVWPAIAAALDALRRHNDVVVIEGAGSPAEINLMDSDVVNLRVARHADAACLLVADIDRGGAFAHLYGTWALLPEADRARIRGFVLNKFRGDARLLAPAPERLQALTGVPTVGVIPMCPRHGLPEEDGVFDDRSTANEPFGAGGTGTQRLLTVAVVAYPRMSNLDEFQPLKAAPGVRLRWARSPAALVGADWVILPGSKATVADLAWLRQQGLDAAITEHVRAGGAVLGICGGLQMLGEAIVDPLGVEAPPAALEAEGQGAEGEGADGLAHGANAPGLGLLPLVTAFAARKTVRKSRVRFAGLGAGAWAALEGVQAQGYEIHHGHTQPHPALVAAGQPLHAVLHGADGEALGWQSACGRVLGVYVHGLFECPAVAQALLGSEGDALQAALDRLAATLAAALGERTLAGLLRPR